MVLTVRSFAGDADVPALHAFARAALLRRAPLEAAWHPGDFSWELKDSEKLGPKLRVVCEGETVLAVGWFFEAEEIWLESVSVYAETVLLDYAEERARRHGHSAMALRTDVADVRRVAVLEARGFQRDAPEAVLLRADLRGDLPAPSLPAGMRFRDCVGIDAEERALAHRDAWDHLAHIGIADAMSAFRAETYRTLIAAPNYDPTLDLLIEADGALVCNVTFWADAATGIGTIEPLGTHVRYRGRGLARAAVLEGLARLKARGHAQARVSTAHFNAPAIATYLSAGFVEIGRTWWMRKGLSS